MKKLYIKYAFFLGLGLIAMLTSCGCANCECDTPTTAPIVVAPKIDSLPADAVWVDPGTLEPNFDDDSIGQPTEQY